MGISAGQLRRKILGDKYNAVICEKGRDRGIYIVGGYVRDTLRGARSQDRDFVIAGDLTSFVHGVRDVFGGTIVRFRKGDMVRLALGSGLTFDFASPVGTMEEDLSKRDFTVNAIAWTPERGVVDMHQGLEDLEKNVIRMISESNLISDPLRILRAYRFAAELGGSIEKRTRDAIKTLHNRIENVSSERITLELFHLLNSEHSSKYLKSALSDGVLSDILLLPDKVLDGNIRAISKVEGGVLQELPVRIKVLLDETFSQNLTYKGLLCLELLLQGSIPGVRKIRMSSNITKRLELAFRGLAESKKCRSELKEKLFDVFVCSKDAAVDVMIIAGRLDLLKEYKKFRKIMKDGFLESEDVMEMAGIEPGPVVGKIILALRRAEFQSIVKSEKEAVDFVRSYQK
jgi:tRNA nucleotidyltransferase/poly(A) polymerase